MTVRYIVETAYESVNKFGEELCGDQIRLLANEDKTRAVLSDGLGSGVKANILSSLTAEISVRMLRENISIQEVIETILKTLPIDKTLNLAYATNTLIEIDTISLKYRLYNFDNPPVLYFHNKKNAPLNCIQHQVMGYNLKVCEGTLSKGDVFIVMSDGLPHAGIGNVYNHSWDQDAIAAYIEDLFKYFPSDIKNIVQKTVTHTRDLCADRPADDISMLGLYLRPKQATIVFTGPPSDPSEDAELVRRVLSFEGFRIVCGGTTSHLISAINGRQITNNPRTMHKDVPPVGNLPGIDLLTEGILTLSNVLEWLELSHGNPAVLPKDENAGLQVARELLYSDEITFLVGLAVNPIYQNPTLPQSVSIRKNLVEKIAERLKQFGKIVHVEFH